MTKSTLSPPESWLELPEGKTFWLKEKCAIGRQGDNDLVIDKTTLSRSHALIAANGGAYVLSDLHSRNGTFLNRSAVTRPVPLRDGDEIRLGDVPVRFRCKRGWFGLAAPKREFDSGHATQRLPQVEERACWLLLADVVGYSALGQSAGSQIALAKVHEWITGIRPHIEGNGGTVNGYIGDAIFAYWPAESADAERIKAILKAIEVWRPTSPLLFRVIAHFGPVLFNHSDRGEELSGQHVNLVFLSEKIAKGFNASAMLSQHAVAALGLEGECESFGRAAVDGMSEFYTFYALPSDFGGSAFLG